MLIKKITVPALLLLLCLWLCACGEGRKNTMDYQSRDFSAYLVFTVEEKPYAAAYDKRAREKTLCFSSPETLAGFTAVQGADGAVTFTKSGLTFAASPEAAALFGITRLFEIPAVCLKDSREENGLTVYYGRDGEDSYEVSLDAAGRPISICGCMDGVRYALTVERFALTGDGETEGKEETE